MDSIIIHINKDDAGKYSSIDIDYPQGVAWNVVFTALVTAVEGAMRTARDEISELHPEDAEHITKALYDMLNISVSNILMQFAPEIEMRPELTAEAIKKAEDEILDSQGLQ